MGKYSLVERCMVIPYNTIEGKYCSGRGFMLYANFLIIIHLNTTKKRVNKDFHIYKPIQITAKNVN